MTDICHLCRNAALMSVYEPQTSAHSAKVFICGHCGLVQTLPRLHGPVLSASPLRTARHLELLEDHVGLDAALRVLDLSVREGEFADLLLRAAPQAHATVLNTAAKRRAQPRLSLIGTRASESLATESFDVVYAAGLLHQLASPRAALRDYWRLLKHGGHLVLEVRDLAAIAHADGAAEWFLDHELYHFTVQSLAALLEISGFCSAATTSESGSIAVIAAKHGISQRPSEPAPDRIKAAQALFAAYEAARDARAHTQAVA